MDADRRRRCVILRGAEEYRIPDMAVSPSDADHVSLLGSIRHQYESDLFMSGGRCHYVNVHLALMTPGEHQHPGIAHENQCGKARAKRFVTNFDEFNGFNFVTLPGVPSNGSWRLRHGGYCWGIPHQLINGEFIGLKRVYEFYKNNGIKTKWIMNIYNTIDDTSFIQNGMVLREIFENKSGDYNPQPELVFPSGGPWEPRVTSPALSFLRTHCPYPTTDAGISSLGGIMNPGPSSSISTQQGYSYQHPPNTMEQLNDVLLGEPDTTIADYYQTGGWSSTTDNFISTNSINRTQKKRRLKTGTPRYRSPVWDSFTKVFNKYPDGETLVWSICHYCCKLVKGDSSGGTSNMLRHRLSCNQHQHDNSGGGDMDEHGHQVPLSSAMAMNMERCSSPTLSAAAVTQEQDWSQIQLPGTTGNTAAAGLYQLPGGDEDIWTEEFLNSLIN